VLANFLLGLFWRKTNAVSGMLGALLTIPLSAVLKFLPVWTNGWFPDFPFLDRMSIVFLLLMALMVTVSLISPRKSGEGLEVKLDPQWFRTSPAFIGGSLLICGILTALYTVFW